MKSDRIVIDTNVLISGFIFPASAPGRVLDRAVTSGNLIVTAETLDELATTLMAAKFDGYLSRSARQSVLETLLTQVETVEALRIVRACRDPRDDKCLEAAVNGGADVVVTGDKDLLVLNRFAGIPIVSPAQFLHDVEDER